MKLGLLGKGISYSFSPIIFKTISNKRHISLTYELFDVEKEGIQEVIDQLRNQKIHGLNVTKPYKNAIMSYCDDISEEAKDIGAVNTLVLRNGRVFGDNTDGYGFKSLINFYHLDLSNKHICILGNGGSSKAVFHSIKAYKDAIKVVKRKSSQHETFADQEVFYEDVTHDMCDIWIQTTTIGLHENDKPLIEHSFLEDSVVIDLIYHRKTEIMKAARHSYGGLMMLIFQALRSFEIWSQHHIEDLEGLSLELKEALENELNRK